MAETLTVEPEIILCAAVLLPSGYIVRGHRHNDCLRTLSGMDRGKDLTSLDLVQGFLTSRGRFVNREEAGLIHYGVPFTLYSENVY